MGELLHKHPITGFGKKKITIKKFQIIKSWIVRQFKNEYNPIHFHAGHILELVI